MIVLIDNYDSFTYNLVQYFGEHDSDIRVFRNDAIDVASVDALKPDKLIVSPGPCTPKEAGISMELIKELGPKYPLLGYVWGIKALVAAFGGDVVRADRIMHGKICDMHHQGNPLFAGIASPFVATRYHSLIIKRETCPACLEITAETKEGEIMGVAHKEFPIWGLQFHPESILTECGKQIVKNFMGLKK